MLALANHTFWSANVDTEVLQVLVCVCLACGYGDIVEDRHRRLVLLTKQKGVVRPKFCVAIPRTQVGHMMSKVTMKVLVLLLVHQAVK